MFVRIRSSAVAWGFLATALRVGGNILILPLVLRRLPQEQLGFWYLFLSMGGMVLLLDCGFAPAATRTAGYLWGGARKLLPEGLYDAGSESPRPPPNVALLEDLTASLVGFYRYSSLAVLVILCLGGGSLVWIKSADVAGAGVVRVSWFVFAAACAFNMQGALWPALLSGINGVRAAQKIFFWALAVQYLISTVGLLAGGGLWVLVASFFVQGAVLRIVGRRIYLRMSGIACRRKPGRPSLLPVLWHNAWRQALVSLGAFLILQASTVICSLMLGMHATATYGLSLQIVRLISAVAALWVAVKLPEINALRAQGDHVSIAREFGARIRLTVLTYAAGGVTVLLVAQPLLRAIGARTMPMEPVALAALLLIGLLEMHHTQYALLVMTENTNPFVKPTLLSGLAIVALSLFLAPRLQLWGLILAPGIVQACFNNWWPVYRAVKGLNLRARDYWRCVFGWSRA